jgi:lysophospholipase L1-like esterase
MARSWLLLLAVLALSSGSAAAQSPPLASTPAGCAERSIQRQLERAPAILADWPNLGRYREANARLAPPAKGENRVVFMGDSITEGWGDAGFGPFFPGRSYVNRGISGQTTSQMLVRFRPDVIALDPKVVVILAGTNDIAGNTGLMPLAAVEDNLTSMAELAKAHGIRVVLSSVLPVTDNGRDQQHQPLNRTRCRPPAQIRELNQWMRRYAADHGHVYLDYAAAMSDEKGLLKANLSEDGLHPNAKGYAAMMPLAEKAVAAAIEKKP